MLGRSSKQLRLFTERMSWRFLESPSCWRRTAILCRSTCPFRQSHRRECVAARANSRGARTGARAVIRTSPRVRGRGRLLRERSPKGPSKANGADARQRIDQARRFAAAPWRESTAEALRRELPGVQPPRTCVSVLHRRERQLAAPWRDLTAEALRGLRWEND